MCFAYFAKFGLMNEVGRFRSDRDDYSAGEIVVIRSSRGTELGRVLAHVAVDDSIPRLREILRPADLDDLANARRGEAERHRRFESCRGIFEEGIWPIEPIDLEPLLDEGRSVLYYLGPHKLDVAGLRAALLELRGHDFVFEPVGRDVPDAEIEPADEPETDHGCGSCSSGGGGCGSDSGSGCGTGSSCSSCSVSALVSSRRSQPAR